MSAGKQSHVLGRSHSAVSVLSSELPSVLPSQVSTLGVACCDCSSVRNVRNE